MSIRDHLIQIAQARIALFYHISALELTRLTKCSPTTSLKVIQNIIAGHPQLLTKIKNKWVVVDRERIPTHWGNAYSLIEKLTQNLTHQTAILPEEWHLRRVKFTARNAIAEDSVSMAIRAMKYRESGATQSGAIRIKYVGLRRGEHALWRTVAPIFLEEFSGKWRMVAIDLAKKESRTFQLARILEIDPQLHPITATINIESLERSYSPKKTVHVTLSPDLTPDQALAAKNELGLRSDGNLLLTAGQLHDLKHQYGVEEPNPSIVWPIIHHIEVL